MRQRITILTVLLAFALAGLAGVKMPQLFQDGMVLQRNVDIPVWGWADVGQTVTVSLVDAKGKVLSTSTTAADAQGAWCVTLPKSKKMKPGNGYRLEVKAATAGADGQSVDSKQTGQSVDSDTYIIKDVSLGDVWLCSGQSNIDVTIERVYPWYVKEIDALDNPQVRLFRVQNETSTSGPRDDIRPTRINWLPLTKQNAWLFSAVGTFLGQRMQQSTGVPQGVIVNSWGGTPIEAWVSAKSLQKDYPLLVEKTRLYDNPEYVRTQQRANMLASQRWNKMLDERDPGMAMVEDEYLFTSLGYDDSQWQSINQYQWQWRGIGTTWLRQHVTVDKSHAGQSARLLLGTLFDADVTYVNGRQVGSTSYQYPPRRYDIPEGLLREGDNVITIRFTNKYGAVHFIPEKPYLLAFGDDRQSLNPLPKDVILLSEQWLQCDGTRMPSCPSGDVSLQNMPTTLYNAVLYPLAPMALAGVVWYQGESNTGNARDYAPMLRMLMKDWRERFGQPQLPFVVVQLANYMACVPQPQNTGWSQVREAQRSVAAEDPYAELATAIDLGETQDIHPLRKKELAERIGLCFDRLVFGKRVLLSPQVVKSTVSGQEIRLTIDQAVLPDDALKYFEVCGSDGRYHNATARTDGSTTIVVTSPVERPVALRYAWKDNPLGVNVYNAQGLPMAPFELQL